jgi:hypothetical protein
MSRFGLLTGAAADGLDPTTNPWSLSLLGWCMLISPFIVMAAGYIYAMFKHDQSSQMVRDMMS